MNQARAERPEESRCRGLPDRPRLAVGAVLFVAPDMLLMVERGPGARDEQGKLEGVGGRVRPGCDPVDELRREIAEELGSGVVIDVEDLLCAQVLDFAGPAGKSKRWFVLSYLCRLVSGLPRCQEPHKISALRYLPVHEWLTLPVAQLSKSVPAERAAYRERLRGATGSRGGRPGRAVPSIPP